jgi:hypothetical protein
MIKKIILAEEVETFDKISVEIRKQIFCRENSKFIGWIHIHHDIQHNDTQHNGNQYNGLFCDIQYK